MVLVALGPSSKDILLGLLYIRKKRKNFDFKEIRR